MLKARLLLIIALIIAGVLSHDSTRTTSVSQMSFLSAVESGRYDRAELIEAAARVYFSRPIRGPAAEYLAGVPWQEADPILLKHFTRDDRLKYCLLLLAYHSQYKSMSHDLFSFSGREISAMARRTLWRHQLPMRKSIRYQVELCEKLNDNVASNVLFIAEGPGSKYITIIKDRMYCFEGDYYGDQVAYVLYRGFVAFSQIGRGVSVKDARNGKGTSALVKRLKLPGLLLAELNTVHWKRYSREAPLWSAPYISREFALDFPPRRQNLEGESTPRRMSSDALSH